MSPLYRNYMSKIREILKDKSLPAKLGMICLSLLLIVVLVGVGRKESKTKLRSIKVRIYPDEKLSFIDAAGIIEIMKGEDSSLLSAGTPREKIRLDILESNLESNGFIEDADVSLDLSGALNVKVKQRQAVLRVINSQFEGYYVSKNGIKMRLSNKYSPRLPVASGNIKETRADSNIAHTAVLKDLTRIAAFIAEDDFWRAQIEQLYVDNYMDIHLIPTVGNHSIVFGSADHLENKFKRLKLFYLKGLRRTGWRKYKVINLKFDGQVVAE